MIGRWPMASTMRTPQLTSTTPGLQGIRSQQLTVAGVTERSMTHYFYLISFLETTRKIVPSDDTVYLISML